MTKGLSFELINCYDDLRIHSNKPYFMFIICVNKANLNIWHLLAHSIE